MKVKKPRARVRAVDNLNKVLSRKDFFRNGVSDITMLASAM